MPPGIGSSDRLRRRRVIATVRAADGVFDLDAVAPRPAVAAALDGELTRPRSAPTARRRPGRGWPCRRENWTRRSTTRPPTSTGSGVIRLHHGAIDVSRPRRTARAGAPPDPSGGRRSSRPRTRRLCRRAPTPGSTISSIVVAADLDLLQATRHSRPTLAPAVPTIRAWQSCAGGSFRPRTSGARRSCPRCRRAARTRIVAVASREPDGRTRLRRGAVDPRGPRRRTRSCSPIRTLTRCTSRCPTTCTRSGQWPRRAPRSTCCAKSRWR